MQTYVIQILTMSLLCSLVEMLSPVGEREGLRRAVRLVAALCLLCLMIEPLAGVRDVLGTFDLGAWAAGMEREAEEDYERLMEEKLTVVSREQVEGAVQELLREAFAVGEEECTVTVELEESGGTLAVRGVWIALRGRAVLCDPREIEAAVKERLGCPCTVSLG